MGRSPLKYQSNSGPTSSFSSAMKPSRDTTACITTVAMPRQTSRCPQTHRNDDARGWDGGQAGGRTSGEQQGGVAELVPEVAGGDGLVVGPLGEGPACDRLHQEQVRGLRVVPAGDEAVDDD